MSEKLIDQYRIIHSRERYGDTSVKNLPYMLPLVDELGPTSIIDFGCGQSRLSDALREATGARVERYDPAIPQYSVKPEGVFDLLTNVDVLEHVPEEELDALIAEMAAFAKNAIIVIDTGPAVLILPDGRNAHITQHDAAWWAQRLGKSFPYLEPVRMRSKRRAAFKTWPSKPGRGLRNLSIFLREELKHRLGKLRR